MTEILPVEWDNKLRYLEKKFRGFNFRVGLLTHEISENEAPRIFCAIR